MHQGSQTHIPTFLGMLPVTKYQPQQQILLENPSKTARSGAVLPPHSLHGGQIPADKPCRRVGADWPSLSLLILSPSASPLSSFWWGELHYTSSSWVRLIPSARASFLACYPRSPGLALDTLESCPGSAPVSPRDCHRLQLAHARENTSSCL